MKKNILAENMLRFGTKNLSEANLQDLENIGFGGSRDPKTGNTLQLSQEDMVTFNGKQHAVLASAYDKASIEPNDSFTANKIREAGANPVNWVLLQATPGPYDSAYDDLGPDQLRSQWDYGSWMFVSADKLQPAGASTSANLTDKSWEGFLKAIANKINTDANDPRTNLTSAEIDSAYEKFNLDKKTDFFFGPWKQYTNGNTNAVDRAIQEFFPKVK